METLKEVVVDCIIAVTVFVLTAGSCVGSKVCKDEDRPRAEATAKP